MPNPNSASRSKKRILLILLGIPAAAAVLIGGFFLGRALLDPYDCRILGNVSVGGLNVGGMTRAEAREALEAAAAQTLQQLSLEVCLPEETLLLTPADTGIQMDIRAAVKDAYRYGRTGTKEERQAAYAASAEAEHSIGLLPYLTFNDSFIQSTLQDYAARFDTDLAEPSYLLEGTMPSLGTADYSEAAPCQTLRLTIGMPKTRLDADAVYGQITEVLDRAFSAAAAGSYRVDADVPPEIEPKAPDLEAIFKEFHVAPVSDSLDMKTYKPVPGSYGYTFDLEKAKELTAGAAYGETVSIPMEYVRPEILGEEVYFRDVLGHCETKHTDDENRNTNLRLLCKALDGVILEPGQEFSYNETVGERTEEKGYKPATAYSGNRMIKDIGGGVCQGSTTLYNCALLADLEILERVCHGAKVGYITLGLDAAVNWNTKTDLRFKNNFNFPMMIKAEVSDGYVKMQILGTDEKDYYIEMRCGFGEEGDISYAVSYKCKYDKQTGEQISKEREANSTYYKLD